MSRRCLLFLASALSCYGRVESPEGRPPARPDMNRPEPGPMGGAAGGKAPGQACQPLVPVERRIWRLSNAQYSNAVRDLLGLAAGPAVTGGGESPYAFLLSDDEVVSPPLAFSYATAAASAAAEVAPRIPEMAPCPAGPDQDRCAEAFLRGLGARAFRRPLSDVEAGGLMAVYRAGKPDGHAAAIQLVIEGMLQMPAFVYRTELGSPDGARFTLTPHEISAQLSFLLLDSLPDEALSRAASEGTLGREAELAAQVDRLMALPRVRHNIDRIVVDWFGARQVLGRSKDPVLFPEFTEALKHDLLAQTELFVDDVLWSGGGKLADLLRSSRTFLNRSLARHYGLPYPGSTAGDFVAATFPAGERAGILTAGSLMAAHAQEAETSVVHRGLFLRNDVLCLEPTPSPPDVLLSSPDVQAALARLTTERARAEYRLGNTLCASCHAGMDGLGLLFEHYDPLGRYRRDDAHGPVDASADLELAPTVSGHLDGAVQLAERLAGGEQVAACASRKLLGFALGRLIDRPDSCEADQLTERFTRTGGSIPELFRAVALSGALRARAGGMP